MDSHQQGSPFDLDTARIRLLYRIPTAPARGRALELSFNGKSILRGRNWAGEFTVVDISGSAADQSSSCVVDHATGLPFQDGSIDVVVLHRTLDHLSVLARRQGRTFVIRDFLSQVARILAAGGLVVGCVENRYGLEHILRSVKCLTGRAGEADTENSSCRPLSVPACHRALAAAGFEDIRLFSMLPCPDAPSSVLSIEGGWSRRACKRQVEAMRPLVGPSSYVVWRMLAELGVSQYLGAATFFWGRKAC